MLLATQLERVFILKDKGQDIRLTDPEWNSKQKVDKKIKSFKLRFLNSYLINFDILKWLNYSIVYAFF